MFHAAGCACALAVGEQEAGVLLAYGRRSWCLACCDAALRMGGSRCGCGGVVVLQGGRGRQQQRGMPGRSPCLPPVYCQPCRVGAPPGCTRACRIQQHRRTGEASKTASLCACPLGQPLVRLPPPAMPRADSQRPGVRDGYLQARAGAGAPVKLRGLYPALVGLNRTHCGGPALSFI